MKGDARQGPEGKETGQTGAREKEGRRRPDTGRATIRKYGVVTYEISAVKRRCTR